MSAFRNILRSRGLPSSHSLCDSKASGAILRTQQQSSCSSSRCGLSLHGWRAGDPILSGSSVHRDGSNHWVRGVFGLGSEGFAHLHGFGEKTLLSSHTVFLVLIADKFFGGLCGNRVKVRLVPCLLWCFTALGTGTPCLFCFCE